MQDSPNRLGFQVVSDLHLEFGHDQYSHYNLIPNAPYLILAGDTGRLIDYTDYVGFLQRHCLVFEHIYLVLGNHEFHGSSREASLAIARRLADEQGLRGRLTLLHRNRVDLQSNVTLLGCTLWSHVPAEARHAVENKVKDYQHIDNWTVDEHNAEHAKDLVWLKAQLHEIHKEERRRNVIIITHHAPSNQDTSNPIHTKNPWTSAFSTPLLEGEAKSWPGFCSIRYWVFGHTHWTTVCDFGSLVMLSNQRGYVRGRIGPTSSEEEDQRSRQVPSVMKKHTFDECKTINL